MHRPPFSRTKRRTRRSRRLWPRRALKNWLSRHRTPWRRARRRSRRSFFRRAQRRFVYRARAGLRHDHPRRRRKRSGWPRRYSTLHLHNTRRRLRRWWSASALRCRTRSRASRRNGNSRRCGASRGSRRCCGGRRHVSFGWNHHHRRWAVSGSYRTRRHHSRCRRRRRFAHGRGRFCLRRRYWRWSFCPCFHCRHRRPGRRARRWGLNRSLLLGDGAQHIPRSRNTREVDLGFDLFFAVSSARRRLRRTGRRIGAAAKMPPHQFRFVVL
jgi:hypothetical protein